MVHWMACSSGCFAASRPNTRRITHYYFRLPLIEKYLARDANLFFPQRNFGRSELRSVASKDDRREDLIRVWLTEVQERRRSHRLGRVGRRGD